MDHNVDRGSKHFAVFLVGNNFVAQQISGNHLHLGRTSYESGLIFGLALAENGGMDRRRLNLLWRSIPDSCDEHCRITFRREFSRDDPDRSLLSSPEGARRCSPPRGMLAATFPPIPATIRSQLSVNLVANEDASLLTFHSFFSETFVQRITQNLRTGDEFISTVPCRRNQTRRSRRRSFRRRIRE